MLRISVCDDEAMAVQVIATLLREELQSRSLDFNIDIYAKSDDLLKQIEQGTPYDVVFADIDMPGLDGIELGKILRQKRFDFILIYVSGREDLVFDAFQAQPFRFIRKRTFQTQLHTLVDEILQELNRRSSQKIAFRSGASTVFLLPEQIVYVESFRKKQMIHTETQVIEVHSSFQKIMEQLKGLGFVQAHKSYFVNCRFIFSINRSCLELDDHTQIPIGRTQLKNVYDEFRIFAMRDSNPVVQ